MREEEKERVEGKEALKGKIVLEKLKKKDEDGAVERSMEMGIET